MKTKNKYVLILNDEHTTKTFDTIRRLKEWAKNNYYIIKHSPTDINCWYTVVCAYVFGNN